MVFDNSREYLFTLETVFDFRQLCTDVTHPRPSPEGRVEMLFSFVNESFEWLVSPLERGLRGA